MMGRVNRSICSSFGNRYSAQAQVFATFRGSWLNIWEKQLVGRSGTWIEIVKQFHWPTSMTGLPDIISPFLFRFWQEVLVGTMGTLRDSGTGRKGQFLAIRRVLVMINWCQRYIRHEVSLNLLLPTSNEAYIFKKLLSLHMTLRIIVIHIGIAGTRFLERKH